MMLSIAGAVLGFGSYHQCTGHTGNLALLRVFAGSFGCDSVAPGYDPNAAWSCLREDGSDNFLALTSGATPADGDVPAFEGYTYSINTKDVCPETCGSSCAYAPDYDADDNFIAAFFNTPGATCPAIAAAGYCDWTIAGDPTAKAVSWFCGMSCRGGAQWDECIWPSGTEQAAAQCPSFVPAFYNTVEDCEADVPNWVAEDLPITCDGDATGAQCTLGQGALGSTEVYNCPA